MTSTVNKLKKRTGASRQAAPLESSKTQADYLPGTVRRGARLARLGSGSVISKQQRVLIGRLRLAHGGETIGDEALMAYAKHFEQPLTPSHIAAIMDIFGWEPSALPMINEEALAAVVV